VPPDEYAEDLVRGVETHADEIDATITAAVTNWRLDRMAVLDRALLRQATYELLHRADVPVPVVLDEAVELAKTYGGDESPRFVNGVLARIADDHPRG
jgi:N utilization substance protein B